MINTDFLFCPICGHASHTKACRVRMNQSTLHERFCDCYHTPKPPISQPEYEWTAVIHPSGEIVGVCSRADFASKLIDGLHAEQMHKVGAILDEYVTVPIDYDKILTLPWKPCPEPEKD